MKPHSIFFWATSFFLVGVLIASITYGFSQAYVITALIILLLVVLLALSHVVVLSHVIALVVVAVMMAGGAAYFFVFNHFQQPQKIIFNQKVTIEGVIIKSEQRLESQILVVRSGMLGVGSKAPNSQRPMFKVQIVTQRYPKYDYGDKVALEGVIKEPQESSRGYYLKEGVTGTMSFGKITVLAHDQGSSLKAGLLKIRNSIESSYKKVLPLEKAAFLSGLTLGSTAEFSDEFKDKLRVTGTSHLVALSGYNILVIVSSLAFFLGSLRLSQKWQFPIMTLFVIGFVVMTGGEASVVRAAIMAFLMLFAERIGRLYHFRNALAATALVMILYNPNVLVFDIGFQLSFAALIGIVYLGPWLKEKVGWTKKEQGMLKWRENLIMTTSAQIAVLPLLFYHFGYASPLGVLSNLFILEFVPITMGFGFVIAALYLISSTLALIVSWPVSILLGYMLGVINIFTKISHFIGF